jgi:biotin operon repressor
MARHPPRNQPMKLDSMKAAGKHSSPPSRRDTGASNRANSEEVCASQDSFPTAVEVLAYQLGIRLEQARNEHRHADPDDISYGERDFTARDINCAVYSFGALERAYQEFAAVANCDATIVGAGSRLIRDCLEAWNHWSNLHFQRFKLEGAESLGTEFVHKHLEQLVEVIDSMFDHSSQPTAAPWFVLGRVIAELPEDHNDLDDEEDRQGDHNDLDDEEDRQGDHENLSVDTRGLIVTSGLSISRLFPSIHEDRESRQLLPYYPGVHWRWFRIEAGLNALKRSAGQMETQRGPDVPPTNRGSDARECGANKTEQPLPARQATPPNDPPQPEYLGLHLDDGRCVFVCDGGDFPLKRKVLRNLLRILIKNEDSVSNYDGLVNALDTSKAAVQAMKSALDTELRKAGRQIETIRDEGYRLIKMP